MYPGLPCPQGLHRDTGGGVVYYQGEGAARYQMADRMRQAERARVANEVARRKGPGPGKRIATTVASLLALTLKR